MELSTPIPRGRCTSRSVRLPLRRSLEEERDGRSRSRSSARTSIESRTSHPFVDFASRKRLPFLRRNHFADEDRNERRCVTRATFRDLPRPLPDESEDGVGGSPRPISLHPPESVGGGREKERNVAGGGKTLGEKCKWSGVAGENDRACVRAFLRSSSWISPVRSRLSIAADYGNTTTTLREFKRETLTPGAARCARS